MIPLWPCQLYSYFIFIFSLALRASFFLLLLRRRRRLYRCHFVLLVIFGRLMSLSPSRCVCE